MYVPTGWNEKTVQYEELAPMMISLEEWLGLFSLTPVSCKFEDTASRQ